MKKIKLLTLLLLSFIISSCDKDEINHISADTLKFENLHAPADVRDHQTGEITEEREFIYFDISKNKIVEKSEAWDIGFKGTVIIVNGGINGSKDVSAAVVISTFDDLVEAPSDDKFKQDDELAYAIPKGSGNGWYNYNPANHLISPIPGRILIIKTTEGNFAKMEILSYYKDAPNNPDPTVPNSDAYFTFNYAYQTNGSKKF